jgi:hypothetical protein
MILVEGDKRQACIELLLLGVVLDSLTLTLTGNGNPGGNDDDTANL